MDYIKNDIFVEQLVPIKNTGKIKITKILIWSICLLMAVGFIAASLLFQSVATLIMLLAPAALFFAYYLCSQLNNEFEYIYTNREIDIDRIVNQKKRVRMANFTCDDIQKIEKYDTQKHRTVKQSRINCYFACTPDDNSYAFFIRHPKNGYYILIMTPSDDFKDALRKGLPYQLKKSI